jgi:hypothetical protein
LVPKDNIKAADALLQGALDLHALIDHSSPAATFLHPMTDAQIAPEWCYNKCLHIITHEPCTCDACTSWALHYLEEILDGAPSLRDAEHERDTDITDSLRGERESLLADNTALHEQLNTLNSILEECNKQKDQAYLALEDKTA